MVADNAIAPNWAFAHSQCSLEPARSKEGYGASHYLYVGIRGNRTWMGTKKYPQKNNDQGQLKGDRYSPGYKPGRQNKERKPCWMIGCKWIHPVYSTPLYVGVRQSGANPSRDNNYLLD